MKKSICSFRSLFSHRLPISLLSGASLLVTAALSSAEWKPVPGRIMTRWAADVKPEAPLPEYPRPQLERTQWTNLNGIWSYAIVGDKQTGVPQEPILVPFPLESALSGVGKTLGENQSLWYRREADLKKTPGQRCLLHFGAVDWKATVWVNGKLQGEHTGGYDSFSFDVTDALKDSGRQEISVKVEDPTDGPAGIPRGKQVTKPEGIFYTSVTGIWQTVWAESVPDNYIKEVSFVPDIDRAEVEVTVWTHRPAKVKLTSPAFLGTQEIDSGFTTRLKVSNAQLWSPETPHLNKVALAITGGDAASSYFAMRKISLGKDAQGITRICLNNQPYFHYGPLDQGWWPDGLYTAPTDAALRYDLEQTKKWGMNMLRKHVKVEPARLYYHCDVLGLLVWQDMPSMNGFLRSDAREDLTLSASARANFISEWQEIMREFRFFPSIVMWVPFNEGWGQFDTAEVLDMTKRLDPSRLVNGPSGWTDRHTGDAHDMHNYPNPSMFPPEPNRATVLGEFGGLGLPVTGHTWVESDKNWGYRTYANMGELGAAYTAQMRQLRPLVWKGLSAAIYTQTTDVEVEVNGLMTYDRAVEKWPKEALEPTLALYKEKGTVTDLVASSQHAPQLWRYATTAPAAGWETPAFDAAAWSEGPGGFGTKGTPNSQVRTEWSQPEIWIRRRFALDAATVASLAKGDLLLDIYHDEDAEVYLNGTKVATLTGHNGSYNQLPLGPEARSALKAGENLIAIHCKQTRGGQYIDAGLSLSVEAGK